MIKKLSLKFSKWLCSQLDWTQQKTIDKINYGFLCLSYNFIKIIILVLIAVILDVLPYLIIFLMAYGLLRLLSFGLHMDSPIQCLVLTTITTFSCIYISLYVPILNVVNYFLTIFSFVSYWLYAPSYMKNKVKRNHKKRKQLHQYTILTVSFLYVICLLVNNEVYSKLIYLACFLQAIMIMPFTFKLFGKEVYYE